MTKTIPELITYLKAKKNVKNVEIFEAANLSKSALHKIMDRGSCRTDTLIDIIATFDGNVKVRIGKEEITIKKQNK